MTISVIAIALLTAIGAPISSSTTNASPTPVVPDTTEVWEGVLHVPGMDLRLELHIEQDADGELTGTLVSLDQGNVSIPVDRIERTESLLTFGSAAIQGSYTGQIADDGRRADGTWTQGPASLPLVLSKRIE